MGRVDAPPSTPDWTLVDWPHFTIPVPVPPTDFRMAFPSVVDPGRPGGRRALSAPAEPRPPKIGTGFHRGSHWTRELATPLTPRVAPPSGRERQGLGRARRRPARRRRHCRCPRLPPRICRNQRTTARGCRQRRRPRLLGPERRWSALTGNGVPSRRPRGSALGSYQHRQQGQGAPPHRCYATHARTAVSRAKPTINTPMTPTAATPRHRTPTPMSGMHQPPLQRPGRTRPAKVARTGRSPRRRGRLARTRRSPRGRRRGQVGRAPDA